MSGFYPDPDADRDDGLAERDDEQQPVPLDEVGRVERPQLRAQHHGVTPAPAPGPVFGEERCDELQDQSQQPQTVGARAVEQPRRRDGQRGERVRHRVPDDITAVAAGVERAVHEDDGQEAQAEDHTAVVEGARDGQRAHQERTHAQHQQDPP